jgi:hypothetical protein
MFQISRIIKWLSFGHFDEHRNSPVFGYCIRSRDIYSRLQLPDSENNTASRPLQAGLFELEGRSSIVPTGRPMYSPSNDDDDDCFSVQLEGSEMSPKAPQVRFAFYFNNDSKLSLRNTDDFPAEIRYETLSSGARRKINKPSKNHGVSCIRLMVMLVKADGPITSLPVTVDNCTNHTAPDGSR